MIKLFLLSFVVVLFSACGGSAPAPAKKVPVPKWVNSVLPSDTPTTMYGLAIEKNRDSAIKAALTDMVSRLGITIESSFKSKQKVESSYSTLTVQNDIKADISKISINNYKVVKTHRISYKEFAVMIESDKPKFVKGLKDSLKVSKTSIKQKVNSLKGADLLTKYNTSKAIAKDAQDLLSVVLMISELDTKFDKKSNLAFIAEKENAFLKARNGLSFFIRGDKRSEKFVDNIKNHLANQGFNIATSKKNALYIKIATNDNLSKGSVSIAVLTLNVGVYDKSKRVGGKSIILKERYNGSKESVYKNASIHFGDDLKSLGINKAIGITLDID